LIRIGGLTGDKWKEYKALRLEGLRQDPSAFGSSVEEEEALSEEDWKRRIHNVLFAMSDKKLVGMIVFVTNDRPKLAHVADIYGVYVRPDSRGKGVGTSLLKSVLSEIRKNRRVTKVKLSVNPEQKAAVRLYNDSGFVAVGRARKDLKVGRRYYDLVYMEKLL
jgi:ribosomal protein S18 acetylase RimI-like enzyme